MSNVKSALEILAKVLEKNFRHSLFLVLLQAKNYKRYQNWASSRLFFNDFPQFYGSSMYHFWVLRTSEPIFQNSYEWVLLEIKAYNCVGLTPRQRTQVFTPIQTNLLKPTDWLQILNLAVEQPFLQNISWWLLL